MTSDNHFYDQWVHELLQSVETLREDKQELLVRVAKLEQMLAEYGHKISNLVQTKGYE